MLTTVRQAPKSRRAPFALAPLSSQPPVAASTDTVVGVTRPCRSRCWRPKQGFDSSRSSGVTLTGRREPRTSPELPTLLGRSGDIA